MDKIKDNLSNLNKEPGSVKEYINNNKYLFESIGLLGVISGIFLQISAYDNEWLSKIQMLLLVALSFLLIYSLFDFYLFISERWKNDLSNNISSILFSFIVVLVFSIINFIWNVFSAEIRSVYPYFSIPILFITYSYLDKFINYIKQNFRFKITLSILKDLVASYIFILLVGIFMSPNLASISWFWLSPIPVSFLKIPVHLGTMTEVYFTKLLCLVALNSLVLWFLVKIWVEYLS